MCINKNDTSVKNFRNISNIRIRILEYYIRKTRKFSFILLKSFII